MLYFFLQAVQIVALQSVHHEQRSTDVPQEEHHAVSEVLESDVTWLHFYLFVHLALKVGCFRICYRSSLTNLPFVNTLSLEVLLVEAFFGWVEQRVVKVLEVLLDEPDDAHMYYKVLARKRVRVAASRLGYVRCTSTTVSWASAVRTVVMVALRGPLEAFVKQS